MKEQMLPSPPPGPDVTASQGKPVSVHVHSHPNASHRKLSHQEHNEVYTVFSIFHSCLKYSAGRRQHLWSVEWRCFVLRGPACRDSVTSSHSVTKSSLLTVFIKDNFGKHFLQRKHLLSHG